MTTTSKDFKVKNGIQVTLDAQFEGTVSIGSFSETSHAVTKQYVDEVSLAEISSTAPTSPFAGKLWLDSTESRLKIYSGSEWSVIATTEDANYVPDHIHDTSIEGSGRITEILG